MAQPNQVNLEIEDEAAAESSNRNNPLHRMDSVSRPLVPNRNNLGLGDRLNSVFREIRPLVEHARMVSHICYVFIIMTQQHLSPIAVNIILVTIYTGKGRFLQYDIEVKDILFYYTIINAKYLV